MKLTIAKYMVAGAGALMTLAVFAAGGAGGDIQYADPDKHFHPMGKAPSKHTLEIIKAARETLPFEDKRDFEEAKRGFIAPLNAKVIVAEA